MAIKSTRGLFARGVGITATATLGLFARGFGVGTTSGGGGIAGNRVAPFTVAQGAQLFQKVAYGVEAQYIAPTDGRASRWDMAQPTLAQQRQRIEATQKVRAAEKQERETALWLASMLPQLEDME